VGISTPNPDQTWVKSRERTAKVLESVILQAETGDQPDLDYDALSSYSGSVFRSVVTSE
jgi:hypothetical protein